MDYKLVTVTSVAIAVILVLGSNLGILQAQYGGKINDGGKRGILGLQGRPGPGIWYGHVIVIVAVWGDVNGCTGDATPSSFTQNVFGNQSPNTFVEGSGTVNCATVGVPTPSNSLSGTCSFPSTNVTLGYGSYQVTQAMNSFTTTTPYSADCSCSTPYSVSYSADCSGIIHANETKTCVINDLVLD